MAGATDFTYDENLHEVPASPAALLEHVRLLEESLTPTMFASVRVSLLGEIGAWYRILGHLEKAEMHLREALRLIDEQGLDARFSIQQRIRLATVLQWQRRFNQSNSLFDQLVDECAQLPEGAPYLAFALQHSGKNLFDQGRYEEALENFEAASEIRNSSEVPADQIRATDMAIAEAKKRLAARAR